MSSAPTGLQRLLLARERGVVGREDALAFQRSLHFPAHFASKLCIEHIYEGHKGCVNRLGWNADGSLLVSGSDDKRAIIWHYPDVERPPLALTTEHHANIFGCQFLPCTGDRRIVTGAMDDTVQLHDLEDSPAAAAVARGAAGCQGTAAGGSGGGGSGGSGGGAHAMRRRPAASANPQLRLVTPRTKVYQSHKDRVKDVKVEPMNPHNFWSGGEDGDVRQYDTRMPNQDKWESPTVFVQVRDGHRTVQVKSLDINKAHPHLMAVAGSDPYIRLYDRRKLGTGHWKRRGATPAMMLLAPPHMPLAAAARHGRAHATYVSFSNRGDKVVTTYHGDHAYCFDITAAGDMAALFPQPPAAAPRQLPGRQAARAMGSARAARACAWGDAADDAAGGRGSPLEEESSPGPPGWSGRSGGGSSSSSSHSVALPPRAEEAKARGNAATFERRWAAAVKAFSEALYFAPGAPVLYALRAEALLRRGWVGDAALALRDCDTAVALDEGCSRAFLSRIQALQALQQYQCALTAVDEYRRRFPGRAADDVAKLAAQLRASVDERRRLYEARRQQQEGRRVQRAEALARTPRRVAASPPPRSRRPRSAAADAGAGAAGTSTAAATAAAAAATPARRSAGPKPSAAAASDAAAAASPAATEQTAATAAAAAAELSSSSAAGEPLAADGAAPMEVAEPEIGPPPPPPPPPAPYPAEDSADGVAAAAAADAVAADPSSAAGRSDRMTDAGGSAAASPAPVVNGFAGAPGSTAAAPPPGAEQLGDSAPPGPGTRGEVEGGLEGVWEEAEAEAADEGRLPLLGDDGMGDGESDGGEAEEEEEEERAPRLLSEDEYGSEDDDELMFVRERDGGEEDPDLELFLQYYARAMELVSTSSGSSSDGAGRGGPRAGVSTPAGPASSRHLGGAAAACGDRRSWGPAPPPAAARHVPGAWGGSAGGRRMLQRYVGQCNVQTDIKEVNFVGSDDRVVAAGSDCGRVFLYDADSGAVLRALAADDDVANCVQCHPTLPVLATSGIENVVRLWSPRDAAPAAAAVSELEEELAAVVERNQSRMKEGPTVFRPSVLQDALQENPQLLHLFMSQLYGRGVLAGRGARGASAGRAGAGDEGAGGEDDDDEEEGEDGQPEVSCRMA